MVAGRPVDVECKSTGSRPEAVITWWLGTRQIQRLAKHVSLLGGLFQEAQLAHKQSNRSLCPSSFFLSLSSFAVLGNWQSVAKCAHLHPHPRGGRQVLDVPRGESFYGRQRHRGQVAPGGSL